MDFRSAYLNAPIDCDIYVVQRIQREITNNGENLVWRLKKSLYMDLNNLEKTGTLLYMPILLKVGTHERLKKKRKDPCVVIESMTRFN